jgi:hypothetical protein
MGPRGVRDLFAQVEAAGMEAVARPRALWVGVPRPIHISGYDRKVGDFYATPDWVTEALLRHVQFRGRVWELCCGGGAITTVMQRRGDYVTSTDIADHGFGTPGIDFLWPMSSRFSALPMLSISSVICSMSARTSFPARSRLQAKKSRS